MTKILVVGGTGFIGSYIAKRLLDEGHNIVCFDSFLDHSKYNFIGQKAVFHKGDITYIEEIISAVKKYNVDEIISLAFLMPLEAEKNLQLAVRVNALGVNNVFEAAQLCGIKRVVYSSSISVYGNVSWYGDNPARENPEDFHLAKNVYGASKQFNEFMAGRYNEYHGMEIVGIRASIVFGYGQSRAATMWIDSAVSNPVRGIPANIPLKSSQKVSLIYVKDLAELFFKIVTAEKLKHQIYNSGGHTVSLREFAGIVKKHIPDAEFVFDEEAPAFYIVHSVDDSRVCDEFKPIRSTLEENIVDQIKIVRGAEALMDLK